MNENSLNRTKVLAKIANKEYRGNSRQFQADLEEVYFTEKHPKRQMIFDLARAYGEVHCGYEGVLAVYDDLCNLIEINSGG